MPKNGIESREPLFILLEGWSSLIPNLSIKRKGKAHPCKVMSARSSDQPILPPLHWEPVPLSKHFHILCEPKSSLAGKKDFVASTESRDTETVDLPSVV